MSEQPPAPQGGQVSGPAPTGNYAAAPQVGPRAGFWQRFLAALVDGLILSVVGYIFGQIFGQDVVKAEDAAVSYSLSGTAAGLTLLVQLAYYTYFEGSDAGQTLGKKLMGIRVIDANRGGSIGYGRAFIRWIGRLVSSAVCLLGYFWMLWDKNKQTWHDKFASSIVVPTEAYPVK